MAGLAGRASPLAAVGVHASDALVGPARGPRSPDTGRRGFARARSSPLAQACGPRPPGARAVGPSARSSISIARPRRQRRLAGLGRAPLLASSVHVDEHPVPELLERWGARQQLARPGVEPRGPFDAQEQAAHGLEQDQGARTVSGAWACQGGGLIQGAGSAGRFMGISGARARGPGVGGNRVPGSPPKSSRRRPRGLGLTRTDRRACSRERHPRASGCRVSGRPASFRVSTPS